CQRRHDVGESEKYICPCCGLNIDRDINAAINIRNHAKLSFNL
ncbi:MAG: zinc ribbon domain-containing protein, partial [Bacillales bacterium]|nr:zinc ribbon domain-containing protein [Bacillales bacterium]